MPLVLPKSLLFPCANGKINDRKALHNVMGPSSNAYNPIALSEWRIEILGQPGVFP